MRRALPLVLLVLAVPASASATTLRLDGIGPLELGMTTKAAVATGWLAHKGKGCELQSPVPVTYRLNGTKAPRGLVGNVEFSGGKLTGLTVSKGAKTAAGVTAGTTTLKGMARLYRARGYKVRLDDSPTFGGTFVTVRKKGKAVLSAFGVTKVDVLGVPTVPACD